MADKLTFAPEAATQLEPHLPPSSGQKTATTSSAPFVTLTFATSLDSSLSLAPGVRTRLSGPGSKAMTHYLRSRHAAILIGVSTLLADDPALNCRIAGVTAQPRPIVIDPHLRWTPRREDKVLETCRRGDGLAPLVVTGVEQGDVPEDAARVLREHGGRYLHVKPLLEDEENKTSASGAGRMRFDWADVFAALKREHGLDSVMVEGGGQIINSLLRPRYHGLVSSVIVTIAPTWLGTGGVVVSPDRVCDESGTPVAAARLRDVRWLPFGEDVVLCGRLQTE